MTYSSAKNYKQKVYSNALQFIITRFLYGDDSSYHPAPSALKRWVDWIRVVKGDDCKQVRYIPDSTGGLLMADFVDSSISVFHPPTGRGGRRMPEEVITFTASQVDHFQRILRCSNMTGMGGIYCGFCPACLSWKTERKIFIHKPKEIRRLQRDLSELGALINGGVGSIKRVEREVLRAGGMNYQGYGRMLLRRLERLRSWAMGNPLMIKGTKEQMLESLVRTIRDRACLPQAKLLQVPHYFISVSIPRCLHILFQADEAWFPVKTWSWDRRREGVALQAVLRRLSDTSPKNSFIELLRYLLRGMVVAAVKAQYPAIELTMEYQVHPVGSQKCVPDLHLLVATYGTDRETGELVEIKLDDVMLRPELTAIFTTIANLVCWAGRKWGAGNRTAAFQNWREQVKVASETFEADGLDSRVVDCELVKVEDLLTVHHYIRRHPMERVEKLRYDETTGKVQVRYYTEVGKWPKRARFSLVEFMRRLAGEDERKSSLGVGYAGVYASSRFKRRRERVAAFYEALQRDRGQGRAAFKKTGLEDCRPVLPGE